MSQTKYKLDQDIRGIVIRHCRKYKETREWYEEIQAAAKCLGAYEIGLPRGNDISKTTERKAVKLVELEKTVKVQMLTAIERAYTLIGDDIDDDVIRTKLRNAIWTSTLEARNYPYEFHNVPTIGRDEFYERKRKFLWLVAELVGLN